jgi:hypothetical protein
MLAQAEVFARSFHNQTTVHSVGLVTLILLGIAQFLLPRRRALLPVIIMATVVPIAQRVVILGLDFNFLRVLVLCGWLRVLLRGEYSSFRWRSLDLILVAWTVARIITYTVLNNSMSALILRLGLSFDSIGLYFLFRVLIRGWNDIHSLVKAFLVISVPLAILFLIERFTQRNLLSFLGGVPEVTRMRNGRLRCQGPYAHPILAGCYWASLLPLMGARFLRRGGDTLALVGMLCSCIIIINCASSTPVASTIAGMIGMLFFPLRRNMSLIRWGGLACLLMMHWTMNRPVWHLISRIDLAGGSTGWHRFQLIEATIRNFDEWWAIGVVSTAHWGNLMADITNTYILEAVQGGLVTLILFVSMLAFAYARVGSLWRYSGGDRSSALMSWSLGVMLFVHCMNFLAVAYFGHITVLLYLTLAMIGSGPIIRSAKPRRPALIRDRMRVPVPAH